MEVTGNIRDDIWLDVCGDLHHLKRRRLADNNYSSDSFGSRIVTAVDSCNGLDPTLVPFQPNFLGKTVLYLICSF